MTVAITGGSGHIGNCLIQYLLKDGHHVKALARNIYPYIEHEQLEIIKGDLNNQFALNKLCKGADVVIHTAARISLNNNHAKEVYKTNVTGTRNILKAASKANTNKFIHFSSIDAFKPVMKNEVLDEKSALVDKSYSVYAYTKAESERVVMQASKEGMNINIISPTAVFGPHDYRPSHLGKVIMKIATNKLPFCVKGGFNWVDVRDVVEATISSIENGKAGEKYIISGHFASFSEFANLISAYTSCKIPKAIPIFLARMASPFFSLQAYVLNRPPVFTNQSLSILQKACKNISFHKASQDLNYQPRQLVTSIKETIDWFKMHPLK